MITALALVAILGAADGSVAFQEAKPVWLAGRETEMNVQAGFVTAFTKPQEDATLRVTGSTLYRVFVNGEFAGYGPARGPHGFYRVDEWPLRAFLHDGENVVAIEVAGYNSNSYYVLDQPSFVQAEILAGHEVVAATGADGFTAVPLDQRVQKVQRYSFQRPFSEVYTLRPGQARWCLQRPEQPAELSIQPEVPLLPRRVPLPQFTRIAPTLQLARGIISDRDDVKNIWKDRALRDIGPKLKGYPEAELVTIPSIELQHMETSFVDNEATPYVPDAPLQLDADTCAIVDLGINQSGFIGATVTCSEPTRLFVTFDEILSDADVDFKRLGCVNVLTYDLQPGTYALESFEAYTCRYLKFIARQGACDIRNVYLREYVNPNTPATFRAADERLNRLFDAAVQTYRQNAVDLFMDCPHRERAGWLCDSFFTARTAYSLGGDTKVEQNFFENYLMPDSFENLPKGMLPMCYPADHYDGVFIPNWALWFVVQIEEYAQRSHDPDTIRALEPKVRALFDYFKPFENSDGLLEKLQSWVFVEWSKANDFVQDVNYPSNMLYAAALDAAGRIYGNDAWTAKAAGIRDTIRTQSFDGTFFVDNAVRNAVGQLDVTTNRSEVCQYFAFYFGLATPSSHEELWRILRDDFGPQRKSNGAYPEVYPANAFVGNVLRLELLAREGLVQQLLDEAVDYHLYMAELTGTLWENIDTHASCNHGFASHLAHVLLRDVLGINHVDTAAKHVTVRIEDLNLEQCEGSMPTSDGPVSLSWKRDGDRVRYRVAAPPGYAVEVIEVEGVKAEPET